MRILVTGASGFLGKALLPLLSKNNKVYALSRHPLEPSKNIIPLVGDVTKSHLGLDLVPEKIDRVYHLAAIHHLGKDKDGSIWETNTMGTRGVIAFCHRYGVSQLYFCSTAYTTGQGRNVYEKSKVWCDELVRVSGIPHVVTLKPSVVMGTKENPYPGHFSQFVTLLVRAHNRAELIRRKVEGTLRLPVIEPVLRVTGAPDGYLNLVTVDEVAKGIARTRKPGVYWLTNPHPPTLGQLAKWISEVIMVRFEFIAGGFNSSPIESLIAHKVSAFSPYLWGDSFPSDLKGHPLITREFIHETIINSLTIDKK